MGEAREGMRIAGVGVGKGATHSQDGRDPLWPLPLKLGLQLES